LKFHANAMTTKSVIIYHQVKPGVDCPDGACGLWVIWSFLKQQGLEDDEIQIVGETYRQDSEWKEYALPFSPIDKDIYFVDWSGYPRDLMELIAHLATDVVVLDHHKTRLPDLNQLGSLKNFFNGYVPNEIGCGSSIAWNYCFPVLPQPWFIRYVRSRDTGAGGLGYWEGKLPRHEIINTAISGLRKGKTGKDAIAVFDYLNSINEDELDLCAAIADVEEKNNLAWEQVKRWELNPTKINLGQEYSKLMQATKKKLSAEAEKAEIESLSSDLLNIDVPCIKIDDRRCNRHYSWVGTYLGQVNPEAPYVIIYTTDRSSVHLRRPANSEVDCGLVAKAFGGGGHEKAAGFPL
jgi:hypothetical protein